jgi:amino acid transporter
MSSIRPNILLITTDQQRWDALGVAGNRFIKTPNLDRLARDGFYFRRSYVTTPICAISRASILSGQYARRHGIVDFAGTFSDSAMAQTYPMLLRKAGYRTGFIGKYGVGAVTVLITALVYIGIKESRTASNILVVLKLAVIALVIGVGAFYVKPANWSPFAPNGVSGVLSGVASVFFAFIGFDSISTTAEECKNPQRDLPRAMLYCLAICTVLYVLITLVLTGMVNYKELGVSDPLAYVFQKVNLDFVAGVISVSAVVAITSALLVYQLGQPRIWMTMSRDGLIWKRFSTIHPKYKTPSFATIVTGFLVAIPSLFMDLKFFVDLTSVGTFFAFILVCAGILFLDAKGLTAQSKFKVPYINGKYIIGATFVLVFAYAHGLNFLSVIDEKPLLIVFWLVWAVLAVQGFRYNFSLLPVIGVLTNLYLMTELGASNWKIFGIWLVIGLVVYFSYGYRKSKLATK